MRLPLLLRLISLLPARPPVHPVRPQHPHHCRCPHFRCLLPQGWQQLGCQSAGLVTSHALGALCLRGCQLAQLLLLLLVHLSLNQARKGGASSWQAHLPCLGTVFAATEVNSRETSRRKAWQCHPGDTNHRYRNSFSKQPECPAKPFSCRRCRSVYNSKWSLHRGI